MVTPELSEYERTRAVNIERNNARLRALGLISALEEKQSNDLAWKRKARRTTSVESETKSPFETKSSKEKLEKNRKRKDPFKQLTEPLRKSLRVQGKGPEGMPIPDKEDDADDEEETDQRRRRVEECRQARQLAALRYSELSDAEKKAAKENPTATYAHCLHRVRTMTEKALYNRVRVIERSAGKHCVIKMAIFKSCLQDEDMWDLADGKQHTIPNMMRRLRFAVSHEFRSFFFVPQLRLRHWNG